MGTEARLRIMQLLLSAHPGGARCWRNSGRSRHSIGEHVGLLSTLVRKFTNVFLGFLGAARAVTSTLARRRTPNAGSSCRFSAAELLGTRRVPVSGFPKHLIFYKVEGREVFVLRVIHGARDLENLFAG